MRFLKEGLVALALNLAIAMPVEGQDSSMASRDAVVVAVEKKDNYQLVQDYLVRFSNEFLDEVSKESKSVGKNLKKYGDEFREDYLFVHQSCLDLARKSLDGKVSEEDYLNATKKICEKQKKYSSSVDYTDVSVITAENEWVKERARFFRKLLETNRGFKTGEDIIRAAYSRREYEEYVNKQSDKAGELYVKIGEALDCFSILFGGRREVRCVKANACDFYQRSIAKIYGK